MCISAPPPPQDIVGIAAKTAFKVQKEMTWTDYIRVVIEDQTH